MIKQISVFVENKAGRLAAITKLLSENKVDIRALSVADTTDFGILRLIVSEPDRTAVLLRSKGFTVSQNEVIGVSLADEPGGLHAAMQVLEEEEIAVEYMYAFVARGETSAYVIIRVDENEKAIYAFEKNGIRVLSPEEVYYI